MTKNEEQKPEPKLMDFKGRPYETTSSRLKRMRYDHPDWSIVTDVTDSDGRDWVVMRTTITDENGNVIATGMAEEERGSSYINKTSLYENAETSAVGRALGFVGYNAADSIATFEEVKRAVSQQDDGKPEDPAELARIEAEMEARRLRAREQRAKRNGFRGVSS